MAPSAFFNAFAAEQAAEQAALHNAEQTASARIPNTQAGMAATFETQMMDNYIGSDPLSPVKLITSAYDEKHHPMLFYVDQATTQLRLLYRNENTGQSEDPVNLTAMLGLYGEVKYMALSQDQNSLSIYLALAVELSPGSGLCALHVLKPGSPMDFKSDFKAKLLPTTTQQVLKIVDLRMTKAPTDGSYPCIAARVNEPSHAIHEATVNLGQGIWNWVAQPWQLPLGTDIVVDTAWATIQGQQGMWVLSYSTVNGKQDFKLVFYYNVSGKTYQKTVAAPSGLSTLSSLAVFSNEKQQDELFVVGGGLHYFDSSSLIHDNTASKSISTNSMFDAASRASVSQSESQIYVWFQSHLTSGQEDSVLAFVELSYEDLEKAPNTASVEPSPITDDHQDGMYVALAASANNELYDQNVVYISQTNTATYIAQSPTGQWSSPAAFTIPDPESLMTLQTYTTHVVMPILSDPSELFEVTITANDTTCPFINGIKYSIGPTISAQLSIPSLGSIVILHETTDYTVPILTVKYSNVMPPLVIDPSVDTTQKLTALDTKDKLRAATVPDQGGARSKLVSETVSDDDLTNVASTLAGLALRSKELDGVVVPAATTKAPVAAGPTVQKQSKSKKTSFGNDLSSAAHWIDKKGDEVGKSIVSTVHRDGDVVRDFVIHVGKEALHIAIKTKHDVLRVAKIVLKAIAVGWDKVSAFVGALFDFQKIMEVQKEIHTSMHNAIEYGRQLFDNTIDSFIQKSDAFFEGLENRLEGLDSIGQTSSSSLVKGDEKDSSVDKVQTSSKLSIIHHSFASGDPSGKQQTPDPAAGVAKHDEAIEAVLAKAQGAVPEDVEQSLRKFATDFKEVAKTGLTGAKIVQLLKDIAAVLVGVVRTVVHDLLKLFKLLVDSIMEALDQPLNIPILTPLLKVISKASKGKVDLEVPSALEIVSFMMAIIVVEFEALGISPVRPKSLEIAPSLPPLGDATSHTKMLAASAAVRVPASSQSKALTNGQTLHQQRVVPASFQSNGVVNKAAIHQQAVTPPVHMAQARSFMALNLKQNITTEAQVASEPAVAATPPPAPAPTTYTGSFTGYSDICAKLHPAVACLSAAIATVKMALSADTLRFAKQGAHTAAEALEKFEKNEKPSLPLEIADLVVDLCDLGLSVPPWMEGVPARDPMLGGYASSGAQVIFIRGSALIKGRYLRPRDPAPAPGHVELPEMGQQPNPLQGDAPPPVEVPEIGQQPDPLQDDAPVVIHMPAPNVGQVEAHIPMPAVNQIPAHIEAGAVNAATRTQRAKTLFAGRGGPKLILAIADFVFSIGIICDYGYTYHEQRVPKSWDPALASLQDDKMLSMLEGSLGAQGLTAAGLLSMAVGNCMLDNTAEDANILADAIAMGLIVGGGVCDTAGAWADAGLDIARSIRALDAPGAYRGSGHH